ncbi:PspA/IM30 family protein [Marinomonas posidonica]|uniref:Phage shock protein A, PspA n=1 Tax=Marinomonas posidonica (strain CECT 7376 / NCIMB 14433 / IVIA-Po-181) TaxID=491952 RepID=F6CWC4_MARPP|nr:PspA/IM30 family protein [Marinomonas posidonica]AEF53179.1 phage shock protein A, PspA [Marinomonas posidonica IVIA-Po-181]
MTIFRKLFTALKGGANEIGEAVVDANAIRILEQELRDSRESVTKAKESEISLLARQKQAVAKSAALTEQIEDYERNVVMALKKENENLALEIADRIAILQSERDQQKSQAQSFGKSALKIRTQIQTAEAQINDLTTQLEQVKATDSVQKAQETIHANILAGKSSVSSAKESLERIKNKQEYFEARIEAAQEMETQFDLDKKLEEAGISSPQTSAVSILEEIKSRSNYK